MESTVKQRIKHYLNENNISINSLSLQIGIPQRTLNNQINGVSEIGVNTALAICSLFKLNVSEIMLGESSTEKVSIGIPVYDYLPASAGQMGLAAVFENEIPTGNISIPDITATAFFPVVGFSMEPEIRAGDHIGVKQIDNWDRLDTDKIYMIITGDDRMIKRLRQDTENDNTLWCVSTNYKEFKILKTEIKAIYHVVYAGRFV